MKKIADGKEAFMPGISLRDYFAGQTMAAILVLGSNYGYQGGRPLKDEVAKDAYTMADAMLAARKAPPG